MGVPLPAANAAPNAASGLVSISLRLPLPIPPKTADCGPISNPANGDPPGIGAMSDTRTGGVAPGTPDHDAPCGTGRGRLAAPARVAAGSPAGAGGSPQRAATLS